jgi:hypothetical protein
LDLSGTPAVLVRESMNESLHFESIGIIGCVSRATSDNEQSVKSLRGARRGAIYVARGGSSPGVSVVDLNGWGLGTGNHVYDPTFTTFEKGQTFAPLNDNVRLQGASLFPPLQPGDCTINGGSAGTFTLSKDSNLQDMLITAPLVLSTSDMMLGHALDSTFNNSGPSAGCQGGGGNLCASDGIKEVDLTVVGNTMQPSIITLQIGQNPLQGGENPITLAPSPNPPPLRFPPLCTSPFIGGQEVSSIDNTVLQGLYNRLVPGDYLGDPAHGVPPSGKLTKEQNAWFVGPSLPGTPLAGCTKFQLRQQIGHFLYIVDRLRGEVVIFNSNSMVVIDRIELPDPTSLAMSPNLDFLAVTSQTASIVSFIDIDPRSPTFHQVRQSTSVSAQPRGIAWDPGNEDILVCCEGANTVDIISASSLQVRKSVTASLDGPFEVAITPRQETHGYLRDVYFAYILNRNGRVALFESGPNGVNGWGYDDILGVAPQEFARPKAIQPDHVDLRSAVWIAHEGAIDPLSGLAQPAGTGALSKLVIASASFGRLTLNPALTSPSFRDMAFDVVVSLGESQLSGIPVDLAFDDQRNIGASPNPTNGFSAGASIPINGKSLIRNQSPVPAVNTNTPNYMFCAVPNPNGGEGVIDVFDLEAGTLRTDTDAWVAGIQSIPARQVAVVMDYWRQ